MSKIMKMKAIHNALDRLCPLVRTVYDVKDNENESNSQLIPYSSSGVSKLSTMSKIMKMKAIHNTYWSNYGTLTTVYDVKDNENESNSQPKKTSLGLNGTVYDVKDNENESNSQRNFSL